MQGDRIVDHFLAVHSGLDGKSREMINFGPGQGILRRDAQEELSARRMLALLGTDGVAMTYPISTPAGREVTTDVLFPTPVSIVLGLGIELRLRGASGILYALEQSSDLVRWEILDRIRADGWGGGSLGGS